MDAVGEFSVGQWQESGLEGLSGDKSIIRVAAVFESTGAINGRFLVSYLMHYQQQSAENPHNNEARYTGFLSFEGSLNDQSGAFTLEDHGVFANGAPESALSIIGYSGAGDFVGIIGTGKYYAQNGKMIIAIEYRYQP